MAVVKFYDICSKIGSGATPRGGKEVYCDEGISLIRSQNVLDYSFSIEGLVHINDVQADKLRNVIVEENDVLLNITGDSVARVCVVDSSYLPARVNQHVCIIRANKKYVQGSYLLYFLQMNKQYLLQLAAGGATRNALTKDMIGNLELELPSLEQQKRVVSLLDDIQAKIKENKKINDNLEQQLQIIFLGMFGSFIEALPANKCQPLGDLVNSIDNRGKTPPLASNETEYPIIDVKALSGATRIVDYKNCTKYVEDDTYNNWFRSGHPEPMDILISTVGSLAEIKVFYGSKGCVAQNVVAFRSKGISPLYLYQYLITIKNDLVAYNIGSVQPSIKVTHIIKHLIYIPTEVELEKYNSIANVMTEQIYQNCLETERLVQIRDILLPKLMSGELDISKINI